MKRIDHQYQSSSFIFPDSESCSLSTTMRSTLDARDAPLAGRDMRRSAIALVLVSCASNPDATDDTDHTADTDDTDTHGAETDDTDAPTTVETSLSGLRWELPCMTQTTPELCTTLDQLSDNTTLAGATGTTYDVTLRIRGVIEPKTYAGGTAGDGWNRDGTPASDTANIYALTLQADSLDALQIRNIDENGAPIVVPDVPPAPDAYDGQFVQMDVLSVLGR
jgi:hypothetical protein